MSQAARSIMHSPNNDFSAPPVGLFDHNYCHNIRVPIKLEQDSKINVFGKKWSHRFDAADRWTDRLLVQVTTDGDWNKIIDRAFTILKVQYPFLPDQQLRGKAYKKFGISSIMGGSLSRASAIFGGLMPQELLNKRKKAGMTGSKDPSKMELKALQIYAEHATETMRRKQKSPGVVTVVEGSRKGSVESEEESPTPEFDFPAAETHQSPVVSPPNVSSSDSESPTPDFDFPNAISRPPIDSFPPYVGTISSETLTPGFQLFANSATRFDADIVTKTSPGSSQIRRAMKPFIVSPMNSDIFSDDGNIDVVSLLREETQTLSASSSLIDNKKSAGEQESIAIIDIEDDAESSQQTAAKNGDSGSVPKENPSKSSVIASREAARASESGYRNVKEFRTQESSSGNFATKIGNKRKRSASKESQTESEDKENCPTTQESLKEKLDKQLISKSVLKPSCLDDISALASSTRRINLSEACEKNSPPERKRRRLNTDTEITPDFVTENCGLTPFHPPEKKRVQFVDLTEDEDVKIFLDSTEKIPRKPSIDSKFSSIKSNTRDETTAQSPVNDLRRESNSPIETKEPEVINIDSSEDDMKKKHVQSDTLLCFNDPEDNAMHESSTTEEVSSIDIEKVCENDSVSEISVFEDEAEKFPPGTLSIELLVTETISEFLSNRCCEYDLMYGDLIDTDLYRESNLEKSFRNVSRIVISEQVKSILDFLDSDCEDSF